MQGCRKRIPGSKQAVTNSSQPETIESQSLKFIESPFTNVNLEAWQISLWQTMQKKNQIGLEKLEQRTYFEPVARGKYIEVLKFQ